MQELILKIEALYKSMKDLTLKAGVPQSQYDSIIAVTPDITVDELQDRLAFLTSVDENEYRKYHYTYNLLRPEVWDQYRLLGERNLKEQIVLRQQGSILRKAWRKKYGTSAKLVEEARRRNSESESLQSEGEDSIQHSDYDGES